MKQEHISSGEHAIQQQNRTITMGNEEQTNFQCFKQYQQMFKNAKQISMQHNEAILTIQQLEKKLNVLQEKSHTFRDVFRSTIEIQTKKRSRRKFTQIKRNFQCPHENCEKIYGSEASLKQHLKFKHSDLIVNVQDAP